MPEHRLGRILIVDDEIELTRALVDMLNKHSYTTLGFSSGKEALKALGESDFDILLTDMMMPEMDGIALLRAALKLDHNLVAFMMTGQGTVQSAVEAMKIGAFDYVLKPFKLSALLPVLDRAMEVRRLRVENVQLHETVAIYELTTTIAYSLDLNTLMNKTVEAARDQMNADEVSLMLATRTGDELYVAAVCGTDREKILGERVHLEQGIAGWVARSREPLNLYGEVNDVRFAPLHPRRDLGPALSMPMLAGSKLVGVLNVNVKQRRPPFTLGQVKGLMILASVAAAALESAGLFTQLEQAEVRYHSIFANAIDGIFQSTPEGRFTLANPALARMLGYASPEELIASVSDISTQLYVDPARRLELLRRMKKSGKVEGFEFEAHSKDGRRIWISENVRAVCAENGNLLYYEGTTEDITGRKQAEQEIAILAKFPSENPNPVLRLSLDGLLLYANSASAPFLVMWECQVGEAVPQFWCDLAAQALANMENRTVDIECDGKVYSIIASPITGMGYINLYGLDITERKRAADALRLSEEKYRTLIDEINDGFFIANEAGIFTFANPALASIYGFVTPQELIGRRFMDFIAPERLADLTHSQRESMHSSQAPEVINGQILHPDGTHAFVEIKAVSIIQGGKMVGSQGVVRDVTARKRAEEALSFRNAILSTTQEASMDGLLVVDENTHIISYNRRFIEMWGIPGELVKNKVDAPVLEFNTNLVAQPQEFLERVRYLYEHKAETSQEEILLKDGKVFERYSAPMLGPDEHYYGRIWYFHDITESKQAEARIQLQLEHLTALSSIDRLIAGNFDLNLSLSEILGHVTKELGVDAADILILKPTLQMLEYAAGRGFRTKAIRNAHIRLGEGFAGRAALEHKLLQIHNLKDEPNTVFGTTLVTGEDFVCYFAIPLISKGQVKGVLEAYHRSPLVPDPEWLDFFNTLAGQTAIAIENSMLFEKLQRSNLELFLAYDATIEGWSHALDLRDKETEGHTQRVTELTVKLARSFGLTDEDLVQVRWGSLLHDIGKMGVPDGILLKPGPLTDEEWNVMRKHPGLAYEMLVPIDYLRLALDIPYCHHEKWDGTGYPRGLKGENIPLTARIFAVVDVWDALTSDRPYRQAWSEEKTRRHMRSEAGTHFDPQVVAAFFQERK